MIPMPIIVGAPRSGTTLLRFMLDAHPEVAIPPETGFLTIGGDFAAQDDELREAFFGAVTRYPSDMPAWEDFGIPGEVFRAALSGIEPFTVDEGYRAFYRLYAARFGKPRWGDKTPVYCFCLETIASILPEAHFVHIIRDGRDVCLSWRETWFSPGRDIETQAGSWSSFVESARRQGAGCPHYLEIRYEDLILDTRRTLEQVCAFAQLSLDERMLRYYEGAPERLGEHATRRRADGTVALTADERLRQQRATLQPPDRDRVAGWKSSMCVDEQARFDAVAGGLLAELGYERRQP